MMIWLKGKNKTRYLAGLLLVSSLFNIGDVDSDINKVILNIELDSATELVG